MKLTLATTMFTLALVAGPVVAQDSDAASEASAAVAAGDVAAGERVFRQCIACHVVQDDDGELLAGRAGRTGPNLYGVFGREAGSVEGFRYTAGFEKAGEMGLVWTDEALLPYLKDPTAFLREYTGDSSARSNMTLKLRKDEDAINVLAYLHSLMPDAGGEGEAATN